jgi:hypothetical protein
MLNADFQRPAGCCNHYNETDPQQVEAFEKSSGLGIHNRPFRDYGEICSVGGGTAQSQMLIPVMVFPAGT